jgi:hypothetical protein
MQMNLGHYWQTPRRRSQADSADIDDTPGCFDAREIRSENLRDEKLGSLHPESSYIPSELVIISQFKELF